MFQLGKPRKDNADVPKASLRERLRDTKPHVFFLCPAGLLLLRVLAF